MKKETMKCRKEIRLYRWELEELQKQAEKMGLSDSQYLRMLITNRPRDYPEIRKELERMGYELRGRKHLSVREPGAGRARRLDQLGEEYTEERLRQRFGRLPIPEMTGEEICGLCGYNWKSQRQKKRFRKMKKCVLI